MDYMYVYKLTQIVVAAETVAVGGVNLGPGRPTKEATDTTKTLTAFDAKTGFSVELKGISGKINHCKEYLLYKLYLEYDYIYSLNKYVSRDALSLTS